MSRQVIQFPKGGRPRLGGKEYGEQIHFLVPPQMHKEMRQLSEETGEPIAHHLREAFKLYYQIRQGLVRVAPAEKLGQQLDEAALLTESAEKTPSKR